MVLELIEGNEVLFRYNELLSRNGRYSGKRIYNLPTNGIMKIATACEVVAISLYQIPSELGQDSLLELL